MAKQANRMMIGGFVLIAIFIMAASLVIFGSGKFFQKTVKCVMYFEESVKGLSVGSPVLFRGVQIGSVTSIVLEADPTDLKVHIPVLIEYEPEKFKVEGHKVSRDPTKTIPKLIEKGLRAELTTMSFITGQLAIEIGFFPAQGICFTPAKVSEEYQGYIVIPTCLSTTAKLADALEKLDLKAIEKNIDSALEGISKLANDPNLLAALKSLKETMQSAHKFIVNVNGKVNPLAKGVNKVTGSFDKLTNELDKKVKALSASLEKTLAGMDTTLSGFDRTMSSVRSTISPNAPLVVNLENSLQEISRMSEALRELSNYLEEHPSSIIRGKTKPKGE